VFVPQWRGPGPDPNAAPATTATVVSAGRPPRLCDAAATPEPSTLLAAIVANARTIVCFDIVFSLRVDLQSVSPLGTAHAGGRFPRARERRPLETIPSFSGTPIPLEWSRGAPDSLGLGAPTDLLPIQGQGPNERRQPRSQGRRQRAMRTVLRAKARSHPRSARLRSRSASGEPERSETSDLGGAIRSQRSGAGRRNDSLPQARPVAPDSVRPSGRSKRRSRHGRRGERLRVRGDRAAATPLKAASSGTQANGDAYRGCGTEIGLVAALERKEWIDESFSVV
jgi:hypothetical protein